jgi:hypothetical protein
MHTPHHAAACMPCRETCRVSVLTSSLCGCRGLGAGVAPDSSFVPVWFSGVALFGGHVSCVRRGLFVSCHGAGSV